MAGDFSNPRVRGTVWPATSGAVSPTSIKCTPPGARATDCPAGRGRPSAISAMRMTSSSIVMLWIWVAVDTGVAAAVRRSPAEDFSVR